MVRIESKLNDEEMKLQLDDFIFNDESRAMSFLIDFWHDNGYKYTFNKNLDIEDFYIIELTLVK